jgi:hypothetical protein
VSDDKLVNERYIYTPADEIRTLRAERDAALARAEQAEEDYLDACCDHRDPESVDLWRGKPCDVCVTSSTRRDAVVEAAEALVECEKLLIAQKRMLGEEYTTCEHQTALMAAVDALNRDNSPEGDREEGEE